MTYITFCVFVLQVTRVKPQTVIRVHSTQLPTSTGELPFEVCNDTQAMFATSTTYLSQCVRYLTFRDYLFVYD